MTEREERELQEAYTEYKERLISIAESHYHKAQAEDIVQEAFQIACSKPEQMLTSDDPEVWMINTVRNVIRNQWRTDSRWNKKLVFLGDGLEQAADHDAGQLETVLGLPPNIAGVRREDLVLFYRVTLYGMTVKEEAKRLHISVWACWKRFQRTRGKLEKMVKQQQEAKNLSR